MIFVTLVLAFVLPVRGIDKKGVLWKSGKIASTNLNSIFTHNLSLFVCASICTATDDCVAFLTAYNTQQCTGFGSKVGTTVTQIDTTKTIYFHPDYVSVYAALDGRYGIQFLISSAWTKIVIRFFSRCCKIPNVQACPVASGYRLAPAIPFCYKVVTVEKQKLQAEIACQSENGGTLVTVDTDDKWKELNHTLTTQYPDSKCFTSAWRLDDFSDIWLWGNGQQFDVYRHLHPSMPIQIDQTCLKQQKNVWFSDFCYYESHYICEIVM